MSNITPYYSDEETAQNVDTDDTTEVVKYIASSMGIGLGLGLLEGMFIMINPLGIDTRSSLSSRSQFFFRTGLFNAIPTSIACGASAATQLAIRHSGSDYQNYSIHTHAAVFSIIYAFVFRPMILFTNIKTNNWMFSNMEDVLLFRGKYVPGARHKYSIMALAGLSMFVNLEATEVIMHHLTMPSV